jgi:isoleucyl-tRNA synthetase
MVHAMRKKEEIIVRQPLQCISIPAVDKQQQERLEAMRELILKEVNVKELQFVEGSGMLVKKVKCNFRVMGKKFGKIMKSVAAQVGELSQEQIAALEKQGSITLNVEGNDALIELTDVEIISEDIPGWTVANEGNLTVALDITITDALRREGVAREIVKRIQALRKESGFEITDRIVVTLESNETSDAAVEDFRDYICGQVLADDLVIVPAIEGAETFIELDNENKIALKIDRK